MSDTTQNTVTSFFGMLTTLKEIDPANQMQYRKTDDISFSRLFSKVISGVMAYNVTKKEWMFYNDVKWVDDTGGMYVEKICKLFAKALFAYCGRQDIPDDYRKAVSNLGDRRNRVRLIADSRDFLNVSSASFDKQANLFNCLNGVLDLETFELLPHDPKLLLSKCANVKYDPDAFYAEFHDFLMQIMLGDDDKIRFLQQIYGSAMIGKNLNETMYLFYGKSTRNGKGTLCHTMGYMFGDYSMNIQPETLTSLKDKSSRTASGDVARLAGARLVNCSEPKKRMIWDIALIKNMTGRDPLTVRNLHERQFEFQPVYKLIVNTNFLPISSDSSLFDSDRIWVLTFDRHFTYEERDQHLKDKLKEPEILSGILNFCLQGLKRYRKNGDRIHIPECVKNATYEYQMNSDKLLLFMDDCIVRREGVNMSAGTMYEVYCNWCRKNGYNFESKRSFFADLKGKGLLSDTGTVSGGTVHNVVKNCEIDYDAAGQYMGRY